MSFIEKIQNQPKKKRLIILWAATAAVMLVVLIFWFFSFSSNLEKINENNKSGEKEAYPSLFESIKKDFSAFKNIFNASVKEIKDIEVQINEEAQKQGQ